MNEPAYNIVFYGIIQPGRDRPAVIDNMARLFKTRPDKMAPYFAGGRRLIKSNVDRDTAEKYRVALEKIGMVIKMEEAESAPANARAATTQTPVETGDIALAEVGADLIEHPVAVKPRPIGDISDITLAEAGADVIEHPAAVAPRPIGDISDITLAETGTDVIEHPVAVAPRPIGDISDITLAEAGADVIEHPVAVAPRPIGDISDITLAEAGVDIIENPQPKAKAPVPDTSELSIEDN